MTGSSRCGRHRNRLKLTGILNLGVSYALLLSCVPNSGTSVPHASRPRMAVVFSAFFSGISCPICHLHLWFFFSGIVSDLHIFSRFSCVRQIASSYSRVAMQAWRGGCSLVKSPKGNLIKSSCSFLRVNIK